MFKKLIAASLTALVGGVYLLLSIAVRHLLNWAGAQFLFGRR